MPGVTVLGSVNLDVVVRCARLPRPGETVLGSGLARSLGGKGANQAVAATRVGGEVAFLACIGADDAGAFLREQLEREGLRNAKLLVAPDAPSGTAFIAVDDAGNNSIIVVPGANDAWPEGMESHVTSGTVCVGQFEIPHDVTRHCFARNRELGGRNVLNPAPFAPIPHELLALTDRLIVNELEYLAFRSLDPLADVSIIAADLRAWKPCVPTIVTIGAQGVLFKFPAGGGRMAGHRVAAVDATGAGDCFVGVYAALVAQGRDDVDALRHANAAASLSVTRPGAAGAMPAWEDVRSFLQKTAGRQAIEPL